MIFRSILSVSMSFIVLGGITRAEPDAWQQWRGQNRDGTLGSVELPSKLNGNLELAWEKNHSPSYSGPVIFDGMIYTTETVDKKFERVTAYKLSDGSKQWTVQWEGSLAVPLFAASNGDWIRSTPAVSEAGLVVVGMRDHMVCLDPKSGETNWSVDFPKSMGSPIPMFGASCSPLLDGDAIYMQTGGATVKMSMADGSVIWETLPNSTSQSPGAFSSPSIATLCGKRQLLVQTRLELCGVDLETGEVLWKEPIQTFRGMNILTPLAVGDRVFTSAYNGSAQLFEVSRDAEKWTIKEVWQKKQKAYMSSPVIVENTLFLHLQNERFAALDVTTGNEIFTTSPIAKYASIVTDKEQVLALTNNGDLMLIDGKASEFKKRDEMKVAEDSWAYVAVTPSYVAVRDLKRLRVFTRQH